MQDRNFTCSSADCTVASNIPFSTPHSRTEEAVELRVKAAATYRKRAQEARAMAQDVMPEEHKQSLLSIADSYDMLALMTGP